MPRSKLARTVHHSGLSHHRGGPLHYAFGYTELAEALRAEVGDLVSAIAGGWLCPLSLVHLAAARRHGLEFIVEADEEAARILRAHAVVGVRRSKIVMLREDHQPAQGLDVLWALCRDDLAQTVGLKPRTISNRIRAGELDLLDLGATIDWVTHRLPAEIRAGLRLDGFH